MKPAKQYAQSRKDDVFLERIADADDQQMKPMTVDVNKIKDDQEAVNEFLLDEDEIGDGSEGDDEMVVRKGTAREQQVGPKP